MLLHRYLESLLLAVAIGVVLPLSSLLLTPSSLLLFMVWHRLLYICFLYMVGLFDGKKYCFFFLFVFLFVCGRLCTMS
jgi:hypothetical protein